MTSPYPTSIQRPRKFILKFIGIVFCVFGNEFENETGFNNNENDFEKETNNNEIRFEFLDVFETPSAAFNAIENENGFEIFGNKNDFILGVLRTPYPTSRSQMTDNEILFIENENEFDFGLGSFAGMLFYLLNDVVLFVFEKETITKIIFK